MTIQRNATLTEIATGSNADALEQRRLLRKVARTLTHILAESQENLAERISLCHQAEQG